VLRPISAPGGQSSLLQLTRGIQIQCYAAGPEKDDDVHYQLDMGSLIQLEISPNYCADKVNYPENDGQSDCEL
jgi:hypothetical protein